LVGAAIAQDSGKAPPCRRRDKYERGFSAGFSDNADGASALSGAVWESAA
jgi:hypothetical protein